MNLITATQVIKKSPAENNFPKDIICRNLNKYIRAAFRGCLGYELLELLQDDLIDYSSNTVWCESDEYEDGNIAIYEGEAYIFSLVENEDAIVTPDCSANWKLLDKFMTPCYNALYPYLCDYLALYIYGRALPFVRYKGAALGAFIQTQDGNGGEALSTKDFASYQKYIECECAECLEELKEWIKCQHDEGTCDFSCVEFLHDCGDCKDEVQSSGRRIAFRW